MTDNGGMAHSAFDLIIIGGGLTAVAVAYEAAGRGLRSVLLERHGLGSNRGSFEWSSSDFSSLQVSPQRWRRSRLEQQSLKTLLGPLLQKHDLLQALDSQRPGRFSKLIADLGLQGLLAFRQDIIAGDELKALQTGLALKRVKKSQVSLFRPQRLIPLLAQAAQDAGADIQIGQNVVGIKALENQTFAVQSQSVRSGQKQDWIAQRVVNASGDQLGPVAALAGQKITVQRTRHLYLRFAGKLTALAIDLGQGSRLFFDGTNSLMGPITLPPGILPEERDKFDAFVRKQLKEYSRLLPGLDQAELRDYLVRQMAYAPGPSQNPSRLIREARIFDHAQTGQPGFVSIVGGQDFEHLWLARQVIDALKFSAHTHPHELAVLPGVDARCDLQRWTEQFVLPAAAVEKLTQRHAGHAHKMLGLSEESPGGTRMIAPGSGLCAAESQHIGIEEFCLCPNDLILRSDALATGSELAQVIIRVLWQWRRIKNSAASQMLRELLETLQIDYQSRRVLCSSESCRELYTELMATGLSANLQIPPGQNQERA